VQYRVLAVDLDADGNGEATLLFSEPNAWTGGFVPAVTMVFSPECATYDATITAVLVDLASGYAHYLTAPYGDPPAHGADSWQPTPNLFCGRGIIIRVTGGPPNTPGAVTAYPFLGP